MIENIGYDLTTGFGLNLAKKEGHCFDSSLQKGKPLITIIKLTGG